MGGEYEFALQLPQKEKEVGIAQVDEAGVTPEKGIQVGTKPVFLD